MDITLLRPRALHIERRIIYIWLAVGGVLVLLALATVCAQFVYLLRGDPSYIAVEQYGRHSAIVEATAKSPMRFRILSDYILKAIPGDFLVKSFLFRLGQNLLIFVLIHRLFLAFEIRHHQAVIGALLLAFSLCFAFFQSDLSFYTYTDIAFYLLAANLAKTKQFTPILLIAGLAALNRESGIFIPVLPMIFNPDKKSLKFTLGGIAIFIFISGFIRTEIGTAAYSRSRYGEVYPGLRLAYLNIINPHTWTGLAAMFHVLPLSLLHWKFFPGAIKRLFIFLALPWFIAQFTFGSADETRLFLAPLAVVFIPAALLITKNIFTNTHKQP